MKDSKSLASNSARKGRWYVSDRRFTLPFLSYINSARIPRSDIPLVAWERIRKALWPDNDSYTVCVLLASKQQGREFNAAYRNASYVPDVLAFPLAPTQGDIVLVPARIRQRAREDMFAIPYPDALIYFFTHAALHLKGYQHGNAMEAQERRLLQLVGARTPAFLRYRTHSKFVDGQR